VNTAAGDSDAEGDPRGGTMTGEDAMESAQAGARSGARGAGRTPGLVRCRIARVCLPPGHDVDTGDLARQVERELSRLLAVGRTAAGSSAAGHVRLQLAGPATTASVAHAMASHLYRQLTGSQLGPR
jgi:hypothetical protein